MFKIGLPDGMLNRLAEKEWWRDLLAYDDDPLFVAVRDNYLSVYVRGKAIFKRVEEKNGKILATCDRRYFLSGEKGDLVFDGQKFRDKRKNGTVIESLSYNGPSDLKRRVKQIKRHPLVNLDDGDVSDKKRDLSEKACLALRAVRPEVINLEMALPGFVSRGKNIAPRIDMVHLVRSEVQNEPGVAVVFTEAKLFTNKKLVKAECTARVVT